MVYLTGIGNPCGIFCGSNADFQGYTAYKQSGMPNK